MRDLNQLDPHQMTYEELEEDVRAVFGQIETRRADAADRLFTRSEQFAEEANKQRLAEDRAEVERRSAAADAAQTNQRQADQAEYSDRMLGALASASRSTVARNPVTGEPVELRSLFTEAGTRALAGEGFRFGLGDCAEILERSTTTALAGATHSVAAGAGGSAGGIWLPRESGATNLQLRPGERIDAGVWPANSALAATGEGGTKPTLDPASLATDTVVPFAATSNITIQSEAAGRGIEQFTWAGTRKVRRSVNDAFAAGMVTAGGTARTFDTDVVASVDGAVAEIMAIAATLPSLILVDPAHFSALATAGGDDATDAFPAFRGIRLVSSAVAGLAGHAVILDGTAVSYSMSPVEVRSQAQVITNSTDVVVEVWFGLVALGASGVILQDLVA